MTYAGSYDAEGAYPNMGADGLKPFTDWLSSRNVQGALTEYGIPDNDSCWNTVLDNFLRTLEGSVRIRSGTYWAAGPWWGATPSQLSHAMVRTAADGPAPEIPDPRLDGLTRDLIGRRGRRS